MKPVILAAVRPQGEYADVVPVSEYGDAVTVLRGRRDIDLVLCGVFFDETRAFDLLRFVRHELAALPFVACRIGGRAVGPVMVEAMGIAAKSMGAETFIDMPLLDADSATDGEFRSLVLRHVRPK